MDNDVKLLGRDDEPTWSGAVVAVHYGDYRRQELWVSSGANIGNWYPLGGEFGRPRVVEDPRPPLNRMMLGVDWHQPPGTVPLHPHWDDVLARGPVVLLTPGDGDTYLAGWKAGRQHLAGQVENLAYDGPEESTDG